MAADDFIVHLGLVSKSGQASLAVANVAADSWENSSSPSEFVRKTWASVNAGPPLQNSLRGSIFEILIGLALVNSGVAPFYRQAEVTYVNNAKFDFLLWEEGWNPISLSIKTSLRERYKQAELEAGALQNVHRKSENYLITLDPAEVERRRSQLSSAAEFSNLNGLVLADTPELDVLIEYLSTKIYGKPRDFNPMGNNLLIAG